MAIDPAFVENMKKDLIEEKEKIKYRKEAKISKIKEKLQAQRMKEYGRFDGEQKMKKYHEEKQCGCSTGSCGCSKSACK